MIKKQITIPNLVIQVQGSEENSLEEYRNALYNWAQNNEVKIVAINDNMKDNLDRYWELFLLTDNIKTTFSSLQKVVSSFEKSMEVYSSAIIEYPATIILSHGEHGWTDYVTLYNNIEPVMTHKQSFRLN